MRPVGYGLPGWLDTDVYLSAPELRSLGEFCIGEIGDVCPVCRVRRATDRAHMARKGMGGSREEGPTIAICRECHTGDNGLDRQEGWAIAIRRDGQPCVVEATGGSRPLYRDRRSVV